MDRDAINKRWRELTDDGKLDASVNDAEKLFDELSARLRARYNVPTAALAPLGLARLYVTNHIKTNVVASGLFSAIRRADAS